MSTHDTIRDILLARTDPERPDYVPATTMADVGGQWAAAYLEVCSALGRQASPEAAVAIQEAIATGTPSGVRAAVVEGFCEALGASCTPSLLADCLDDDAHDWTGPLAAVLAALE